jgi:hypothetical protein
MTTPVSAATPASAMKPTATATLMLNCIQAISHTPPTRAKGTDSMTAPKMMMDRLEGVSPETKHGAGGQPMLEVMKYLRARVDAGNQRPWARPMRWLGSGSSPV